MHVRFFADRERKLLVDLPVKQNAANRKLFNYFGTKQHVLDATELPRNFADQFLEFCKRGVRITPSRDSRKVRELEDVIIGILGGITRGEYGVSSKSA